MTSGWISRGQRQTRITPTHKNSKVAIVPVGGFPNDEESWGSGSDSVTGAPNLKKLKPTSPVRTSTTPTKLNSPIRPSASSPLPSKASTTVSPPRSPTFQSGIPQRTTPSSSSIHQQRAIATTSPQTGFLDDVSDDEESSSPALQSTPSRPTTKQTPQKQQQYASPRVIRQQQQQQRSPSSRNPFSDFMDLEEIEEDEPSESNDMELTTDIRANSEDDLEDVEEIRVPHFKTTPVAHQDSEDVNDMEPLPDSQVGANEDELEDVEEDDKDTRELQSKITLSITQRQFEDVEEPEEENPSQPSQQHSAHNLIKDEVLEFEEGEESVQQPVDHIVNEPGEDDLKPTPVAHRFALPSANTQNSVQDEPRASRRSKRNGLAAKLVNLLDRQKRSNLNSTATDGTNVCSDQSLLVAIVFGQTSGFSYVTICAVVEEQALADCLPPKNLSFDASDDALLDGEEKEDTTKGSQPLSQPSSQCLVDILFPKEVAETLHLEPGKLVTIHQPFQEFRITEGANPVILCTSCRVVEGLEVLKLVKPVPEAELLNPDRLANWHISPILHPSPEVLEAQWQAIANSIALAEGEMTQSSSQVDPSVAVTTDDGGHPSQDPGLAASDLALHQNFISLRLDEITSLSARVLEVSVQRGIIREETVHTSSSPSRSLFSARFQTLLPFKSSLFQELLPPSVSSSPSLSAEVILRDNEGSYYKLLLQEPFPFVLDWIETLQNSSSSSSSSLSSSPFLLFRHLKAIRRGLWSSRDPPPESVVNLEGLISKEYWLLTTLQTSTLLSKPL